MADLNFQLFTPTRPTWSSLLERERWRNAKKYSLFNEHERGREVKEFDQVFTSDNLSASRVSVAL